MGYEELLDRVFGLHVELLSLFKLFPLTAESGQLVVNTDFDQDGAFIIDIIWDIGQRYLKFLFSSKNTLRTYTLSSFSALGRSVSTVLRQPCW